MRRRVARSISSKTPSASPSRAIARRASRSRSSSLWALDVLIDLGFEYDSSVFPIVHDRYGIPGAKREPDAHHRAVGAHDRGIPDVGGVVRRSAGAGVRRRLLPAAALRRDALPG